MDKLYITEIADKWEEQTYKILALEEASLQEIQELFKATYEILTFYSQSENTPKAMCRLLLNMDEYVNFMGEVSEAEEMESKKYFQLLFDIVNALKTGFLNDNFITPYPELTFNYNDSQIKFNIDSKSLEKLL